MKLPKGATIVIGGKKYKGEIPDVVAEEYGVLKKETVEEVEDQETDTVEKPEKPKGKSKK